MAIVYGFGDYFTDCLNTLTGDNYRAFNQVDNWKAARRPLMAAVGGGSGAYDFTGAYRWPVEPLVVSTEADIMYTTFSSSGDTAEDLVRNLWKKAQSKLWVIRTTDLTSTPFAYRRPRPPDGYFPATYTLSGEILQSAVQVAGPVWLYDTNYQILATTSAIASGTPGYSFSVPAGTYRVHARYYDAAEATASKYYWGTSNETSVTGNTDLDVTVTSAAPAAQAEPRVYWAWAKLISASVVTSTKAKNPRSVKIQAEFEIPEGIFYNMDVKSETRTEAGSKVYTLYNVGSAPTHVKWTLTALTHTITGFRVQNGTSGSDVTWDGSLLATKALILDSATYTATNDGAAAYSGILRTPPITEVGWCVLTPGANSLTISLTQTTTEDYTVAYEYYDAEVL